ncbi:MAG: DMT family transporter [Proteobacteria bacterium]|nr:DMT family transporter [Pseudomonadota bacterium]
MKSDALSPAGLLLLLFVTLGWGTSWPFLKISLNEIPPWTFRGLIAPVAAVFLFGIAYILKEGMTNPRGQWRPLIAASILNITGWHVFSAFGITLLASGHASIIAYTMPLWAILFSIIFIGERPTVKRLAGLVLGIGGLAVLLSGEFGVFASSPSGTVYMLLSAIFWGAGTVIHKRTQWTIPPASLAGWQLMIGGLPVTIAALIIDGPTLEPSSWSGAAIWSTIYVLIIPIVFSWIAWFKVVAGTSVTVATVSTLMIPVIGVISANLVLGEPVGWREIVALVLVCGALALALSRQESKPEISPS